VRYLSVCSGIEAASVAWHSMGWEPVAFSEIDPFASAVLAARFPDVPNLGTMENYREWNIEQGAIDVLVGGTPCQSFSVAGLRRGLDDPRGNLALVYLGLVDRFRPRYIVWENVPGVLSSSGGRDFGAFLGGLAQLGYGFAYRVLDAQYTRVDSHPRAVPQRRRRVFVVGCAGGDWRSAAAVLLEPEGVRGDCPTRSTSRESIAGSPGDGAAQRGATAVIARQLASGRYTEDDVASTLAARDFKSATDLVATSWTPAIAGPLGGAAQTGGFRTTDLDNNGAYVVEPSFSWPVEVADPISAHERGTYTHEGKTFRMHNVVPDVIAFQSNIGSQGGDVFTNVSPTVRLGGHGDNNPPAVAAPTMAVRRLTPRECERLQGFPDEWTAITYRGKPASDGPRYKALGNSMATNVMRWIGLRIQQAEAV
jgi:DNA (cytosine-5)-methyltransferase 1